LKTHSLTFQSLSEHRRSLGADFTDSILDAARERDNVRLYTIDDAVAALGD